MDGSSFSLIFTCIKQPFSSYVIESELICGVSMMVNGKVMQKVGEVYDVYLHGKNWTAVSAFEARRYLKSTNRHHMGKGQVVVWWLIIAL